jgi:hypothetical protein
MWRLTDLGHQRVMDRDSGGPGIAVNVHHGDVAQGSKNTATITGSALGTPAVEDGAAATNTIEGSSSVTQEQLRTAAREAQIALVDDQDTLAQIDARLYEALHQFLRVAREIQVEQMSLAEVQAKMAKTLDEARVHQGAPGWKSGALPETLKVTEALAKSPIFAEIARQLISRGG